MATRVDHLFKAYAEVGEGPVWHERTQKLYWIDILPGEIHCFDPSTGTDECHRVGQYVGAVAPRRKGGLVAALHRGFAFFNPDDDSIESIKGPEPHLTNHRFNDGAVDPAGRFWAGTISLTNEIGMANLYCLERDLSVRHKLDGITNSNGITWSIDQRTMYYIDTPTLAVSAFDYDVETGAIGNRREVIHIEGQGRYPDGMTIDEEGMLWIALWGGGCVERWNPGNGRLLERLELPVANITSCAFGGPNLDLLFITTARYLLSDDQKKAQPEAGDLFIARPSVKGIASREFEG